MVKADEAEQGAPPPRPYRREPLPRPKVDQIVKVTNERELLAVARKLLEQLEKEPGFSVMLLANPVLALREYGIELAPEIEHHVLTSLRHPPRLRARRKELEAKLSAELGEPPRPTDSAWMARLVHERRKIEPRAIDGLAPSYKPPLSDARVAAIRAKHPPATTRYPGERRITVRHRMGVVPPRPAVRRLDLDAELPPRARAGQAPAELSLEQAWFYKDDPVVRDAVELGTIMRRGFPFATPDEFRRIARGEKVDAFRAFVDAVGLKSAAKPAPR